MTADGWLVDTNVISELGKRLPNPAVSAMMKERRIETLFISCVSLAEIRFGVISSKDAVAAANIGGWLDGVVRPMFADRVIDVTEAVMLRWIALVDAARRQQHTYSQPDLIIAAQALELGLTLVTRNTSDFERTGVKILNPWLPRSHT